MAENNFAITSEVTGRGSLQEERATRQGQDRRTPQTGRKGIVAESARETEPLSCGLVGLFQLWNPRPGLLGRRSSCQRARSPLPRQTAQGARTRHTPVFLERNPRKIRGDPTPSNSRRRRRGSAVKSVGKPDAGNPHVRFDERGRETEPLAQRLNATAPFLDSTCESAPRAKRLAALSRICFFQA